MLRELWLIVFFWLNMFVLTRVFETLGIFDQGMGCSVRHGNVSALDMKTLKLILDHRGISYTKVVDKIELFSLLSGSGDLSDGELMMTVKSPLTEERVLQHHGQFDSIGELLFQHLQTEIWLVQIKYDISPMDDGIIDWTSSAEWINFLKTVQTLGVRTATVNCSDSMCLQESWGHGQPVLILPHGKTRIYYQSYYRRADEVSRAPEALLDWLTVRLLKRVQRIESYGELQRDWLSFDKRATWRPQRVNLVFFVNDTVQPPLFLASLSVEFDGRVRIGQISMSALRTDALLSLGVAGPLLIITPETMRPYGTRSGECLTLVSIRMLLASLAPSSADIGSLLLSFGMMACCIELVVTGGGPVRRLLRCFTLLTKLVLSIIVWVVCAELVLIGFDLAVLSDGLSTILRVISLTSFGDQFRNDWLRYSTTNYGMFLVTFVCYSACVGWWHRRARRQQETFVADLHLLRAGITGDEVLVENRQPAAETLWRYFDIDKLQATVGIHYINKLKVFKFSDLFSQAATQHQSDRSDADSLVGNSTADAYSAQFEEHACCTCDCNRRSVPGNPRHSEHIQPTDNEDTLGLVGGSARKTQKKVNFQDDSQRATTVYPQENFVCLLCHAILSADDEITTLPCHHVFHCTCLVSWIQRSNHNCPSCNWPVFHNKNKKLVPSK